MVPTRRDVLAAYPLSPHRSIGLRRREGTTVLRIELVAFATFASHGQHLDARPSNNTRNNTASRYGIMLTGDKLLTAAVLLFRVIPTDSEYSDRPLVRRERGAAARAARRPSLSLPAQLLYVT